MERVELDKFVMSRRSFMKLVGMGGLAAFTLEVLGKHLTGGATLPKFAISQEISGIIPNCPFLPYEKVEVQERMINNLRLWEASCARVFLDYKFEEKLGEYKGNLLDQIAATSRLIPLTVDLFDAYHALHSSTPSSPYLVLKNGRDIYEKQYAIFTDTEVRKALLRRVRVAVTELKDEQGIIAWGLANELNLRKPQHMLLAKAQGRTLREVHTDLFEEMIEEILSIDHKRPITIGVDDPNLIDEKRLDKFKHHVVNTIHVYPGSLHDRIISTYQNGESERILPLICQEVGFSRSMFNTGISVPTEPEYDEITSVFFEQTFSKLFPYIFAFGPWRISAQGDSHSDGFEIEPIRHPRSISVIRDIKSEILTNLVASRVS
ncbi:hypothetical protein A3B39_00310 [Candidatus Daviesbacteria bacterium RIFCSPLOWO2_01_FULL_37_10]|nr:MAG: hypothetical protein A2111_03300 [Candidatus Daviesbacteria bacterium GWA1_38_6]OGE44838.1 MAG: hypothetical protein A3B39_00310 [Candidatus Daviesbacteria bacterium RIFCSPLOWO2_01_FULL_37_10]